MQFREEIFKTYRHTPPHLFKTGAHYFVTAGIHQKKLLLNTPDKKSLVLQILFDESSKLHWQLAAWAILPNHYHFVAELPSDPESLPTLIRRLHSKSAIALNRIDNTPGRKVWYQYWDTCIEDRDAYLARLKYVHENPAKHGLIDDPSEYPWCSMQWFIQTATAEHRAQILAAKTPENISDNF